MKKIVVVGSSNMDVVIQVPHIPVPGETILAQEVSLFTGGKGANQAAAVAKLGGNISMIGCVGNDDHGRALLAQLKAYGVDTHAIATHDSSPTGTAYINVSADGENNIVVNSGANHCLTVDMLLQHSHLLSDAAYCIVQLETPLDSLYALAELCKTQDCCLILNPAPAAQLDFDKLAGTWMIAPNESELALLVPGDGDIPSKAETLRKKGFTHVLVTLGEKGCLLVNESGHTAYPAYTELPVVDTTAAGDSFIGALAFGLSKGDTLADAIHFASRVAAVAVSRMGAQASLPTLAEVEAL